MPYKGSKSKLAQWVIEQLPGSHTLVDIFAGGCAITHAALLSDKWERVIANDHNGMTILFKKAINGEFQDFSEIPSRDDFFLTDDAILKLLYSFGSDQSSYLWGKEYESVKVPASKMLTAPSEYERRKHYRDFIKALRNNMSALIERNRMHELEGLERLEGLEVLGRVEELKEIEGLDRLEIMTADYRNVNIPHGATVYADPPYRNTGEHYGGFD